MKKYKLIKTYPGSPKLGFIIENGYYCDKLYINPKDYPDNWEEVIEKDYEILSFINYAKELFYLNNQGYYDWKGDIKPATWRTLELLLTLAENCKINSVKRLSDGEVFTVGDVCCPIGYNKGTDYSITKFEFVLNNTQLRVSSKNWYLGIENIKKSKPALFTTEDGVDIREGDAFWFVAKGFTGKEPGKLIAEKNIIAQYSEARFSSKEAAQEYIIMNKPCLSITDVKRELINGCDRNPSKTNGSRTLELLKELVKSKL